MLDYKFEDGREVSQLLTAEIQDLLQSGITLAEESAGTEDAVMERLRLELDIRRIEGRL